MGLCDKGIVPDCYGAIKQIDPKLYRPILEIFLADGRPTKRHPPRIQ